MFGARAFTFVSANPSANFAKLGPPCVSVAMARDDMGNLVKHQHAWATIGHEQPLARANANPALVVASGVSMSTRPKAGTIAPIHTAFHEHALKAVTLAIAVKRREVDLRHFYAPIPYHTAGNL